MDTTNQENSKYRNIKEFYKIENTIGKGSSATVKKAKNRETGERFAVKVLTKRKMSEQDMERLHTEINILRSLDHPNIVKLVDIFEDERHICLVMELLLGGELFTEIVEKEQFTELEVREAIKVIIDAISYCHSHGIMHRDIKPENLLLADANKSLSSLKVADFGLSRVLADDDFADTICGSPGYVAPEILLQQPYGMEVDFWSIGVVTYILLSGVPPFYCEDNFELLERIKKCSYDFKDETWEIVSDEAKDFVANIMVADPSKRLKLDQMRAHPWMNVHLDQDKSLANVKDKLFKYVSIRKETAKKKSANNDLEEL